MGAKTPFLLVVLACLATPLPASGQRVDEEQNERLQLTSGEPAGGQSLDLRRVAELIVQKTNEFRKEQGLEPVEVDPQLKETAQYFADYMARTDRYGHTADGKRPSQRAKEHGYEYCIVSENIAYMYRSTGFTEEALAKKLVEGWINSPEHRENMVDPAVTEIGVGVAHSNQSGHYYAVQMFGRPRSASIEFAVVNNSGQVVQYRIAQRKLSLPPRYTRTHTQCRPSDLTFLLSDPAPESQDEGKTVQPDNGDRFVVTQSQNELQVQEE